MIDGIEGNSPLLIEIRLDSKNKSISDINQKEDHELDIDMESPEEEPADNLAIKQAEADRDDSEKSGDYSSED